MLLNIYNYNSLHNLQCESFQQAEGPRSGLILFFSESRNIVAIMASLPAPWLLTAWETLPKPKQTLLLLVHSV